MASTSKYIQLTPQILVEYIYTDTILPEVIETNIGGARIMLLDDSYTGTKFLFNEDNPNTITGNYRTRSAVPVNSDRTKYAYLTDNSALNYLDYDINLPNVSTLQAQLNTAPNVPMQQVQYDTIRVHLISGFSFSDADDGFVFEVKFKDKAYNRHNLVSIAYLRTDSYETLNPKPFIVGEKLYSKYIELKVPALSWMTNEYVTSPGNPNILANQITNNIGLFYQNTVDISVRSINNIDLINGQRFFTMANESTASLNMTDEYSLLSAVIIESEIGDFFELFGEYNSIIYEDFITNLEAQPNTEIIAIHEVRVFEQIGINFIQTSEHSFVQTENFGQPYLFRPIIVNSHVATSYRIDYTLRIYNKFDNTQIIRLSNFSSFDVKKYGRRIRKINLGTLPVLSKVYNTVSNSKPIINLQNISIDSSGAKIITKTEFVVSFRERLKVSSSISSVQTKPAINQSGDIVPTSQSSGNPLGLLPLEIKSITPTDKIWPQNQAPLSISVFDNFTMFVLYDNSIQEATGAKHPQFLDLTNMGNLYLTFTDNDTGNEIRIQNYTNIKDLNPVQGEAIFKISKQDAKKILKIKNNDFYLSSKLEIGTETSDETLIYSGKWYKTDQKFDTVYTDMITDLQNTVNSLTNSLLAEQDASATTINKLQTGIDSLTSLNNKLELKLADVAPDALAQIKATEATSINALQSKNDLAANTLAVNAITLSSASEIPTNGTGPNKQLTAIEQQALDTINKGNGNFLSQHTFNSQSGISSKNFKI